ncbi:MAG: DNA alkylation repair protein [Muribaculum sp.]|nr:DNA alkylation repair protein [Muribaculum sp.]
MDNHEMNPMQAIKHRFFALRNGAIADAMRRQGAPYKIIFGVNLPQLTAIARDTSQSADLAQQLWDNQSTRESMLIAPMLYPREEFGIDVARRWISTAVSAEAIDILCLKLLKTMEYAQSLSEELILSDRELDRYTALRLMFNNVSERIAETKAYALAELSRDSRLTSSAARQLLTEISYLEEE